MRLQALKSGAGLDDAKFALGIKMLLASGMLAQQSEENVKAVELLGCRAGKFMVAGCFTVVQARLCTVLTSVIPIALSAQLIE